MSDNLVFGAGSAVITQTFLSDGTPIDVPQPISVPLVQSIMIPFPEFDAKQLYSNTQMPIRVARGKAKFANIAIECAGATVDFLHRAFFAGDLVTGLSNRIHFDETGRVIPAEYTTVAKIRNVIPLHLGKWISNTSATINGSAATIATETIIPEGKYKVANGFYRFSKLDIGRPFVVTYKVADGTASGQTVVSTLTIPASLNWNVAQYARHLSISSTGYSASDRVDWSETSTIASGKWMSSTNGIYEFDSASTETNITIVYNSDSIRVSTLVAALPTAGYITIIDPPSSSIWTVDKGVYNVTNSADMSQATTPSTGEYDATIDPGVYVFAAADAGDIVNISYKTDFEHFFVNPPEDGFFVADKGVIQSDGTPMTPVALTAPVSLTRGQYAVDNAGGYYFDQTNNGNTVYINYEYQVESGGYQTVASEKMGRTPFFQVDIVGEADGLQAFFKYFKCTPVKCEPTGTKIDDWMIYKLEFAVTMKDSVSQQIGEVHMQAAA